MVLEIVHYESKFKIKQSKTMEIQYGGPKCKIDLMWMKLDTGNFLKRLIAISTPLKTRNYRISRKSNVRVN